MSSEKIPPPTIGKEEQKQGPDEVFSVQDQILKDVTVDTFRAPQYAKRGMQEEMEEIEKQAEERPPVITGRTRKELYTELKELVYEEIERIERGKALRVHQENRLRELDAEAEKLGIVEKGFRKLGERYNKHGWKTKLAVGLSLGIGAGVSLATGAFLPGALFLLGTGVQRSAGMASMFLKYEKSTSDKKLLGLFGKKEKAMGKAMLYTAAMTGGMLLLAEGVKEGVEYANQHKWGEQVQEWLGRMMGHTSSHAPEVVGHQQSVDTTYAVHDQDLSGKVEVSGTPSGEPHVSMSYRGTPYHTPGSQVLARNWRETMNAHPGSLTGTGQDTVRMMAGQIEATKLALDQAVAHGNMEAAQLLHKSLQESVENAKRDFGNIFTAHVTDMPTTHGVVFTEPSHPLPPLTSAIEKHLEHMYASASKTGAQSHLNVAPIHAVTGRGYEEMAYKLGHELYNQYPHGLPNEFANSDAAKLWEAIQQDGTQGHEHLNAALNQLATGHHFLNPDGTSALVGKDAGLTFDAHGNLSFSDAHQASISNATKGMSTTSAYHPEVSAAHEASAAPAEVTPVPTHTVLPPHPATSKPTVVPTSDNIVRDGAGHPVLDGSGNPVHEGVYQQTPGYVSTPPPAPAHPSLEVLHVTSGHEVFTNIHNVPVNLHNTHGYLDGGKIYVLGGNKIDTLAQDYALKHHVSVFVDKSYKLMGLIKVPRVIEYAPTDRGLAMVVHHGPSLVPNPEDFTKRVF